MKALQNWNVTGQNASAAEEAEAVLKMCDADGDGCITYDEFVEGLANHQDMGVEKFGSYERGSKGSRDLKGDPLRDPLSKVRVATRAELQLRVPRRRRTCASRARWLCIRAYVCMPLCEFWRCMHASALSSQIVLHHGTSHPSPLTSPSPPSCALA